MSRSTRPTRTVAISLAVASAAVPLAAACTTPYPVPPPTGAADVVVFDIDGTLTADELSTTTQPGALAAVETYVDKGYAVVYVTARWDAVQRGSTESWLADNGFPDLPLYMAPSLLIDDQSKEDYKTETLADIEAGLPEVIYAYGDSVSDFAAYANAGVPQSQVFALRRSSASTCQSGTYAACLDGYTAHLSYIEALPDAP